jgi:hypothetical protein
MKLPVMGAAVALTVLAPNAQAMSFQFVPLGVNNCTTNCPTVILASGDINLGDAETFVEKVKATLQRDKNLRPVVLISSNGGNVYASMQLGYVMRSMKATVVVASAVSNGSTYVPRRGACGSACVFTLMGGTKRIVPDDSKVGVHWVSGPTPQGYFGNVVQPDLTQTPNGDQSEGILRDYMRRMGVKQELAAFIRKVPHENFHIMTPAEITRFGLAARTFK